MRGRLLLAAALLLMAPSAARTDDERRTPADAPELLVFENGSHRWVFDPGSFPFAKLGDRAIARRLQASLRGQGFRPTPVTAGRLDFGQNVGLPDVEGVQFPKEWLDGPRADRDAEALVAGGGRFPPGYVPAGRQKPAEIPPLDLLGAEVVLELVDGEARGRVTEVPEGSRARKIGLREGDLVLEVGGQTVAPSALLLFQERVAAGAQQGLKVRRSHGGIERIVVDSWVRAPLGR